jgi:two-component system chemotaxis response regulator CheY
MTTLADLDVLIVDDHEAMRTLLTRVLTKAGVTRVRSAADGFEALAMLTAQPANLILADQAMPGMDGISFVVNVRGNPLFGAPRVIMVSGNTNAEHATAARAAGADTVLVKPVTPRDLLAAIEALFAV